MFCYGRLFGSERPVAGSASPFQGRDKSTGPELAYTAGAFPWTVRGEQPRPEPNSVTLSVTHEICRNYPPDKYTFTSETGIVSSQGTGHSTLGFTVLGTTASAGGLLYEEAAMRTVLVAIGATFLLGALLSYTLSSRRYLPAVVHESVYADMATTGWALIETYDLQETLVYVPRTDREQVAALFIPEHREYSVPKSSELDPLLITDPDGGVRGVSLRPSGDTLYARFEAMLDGDVSDTPVELGVQLTDGLVEGFELADRASPDVSSTDNIVEFAIDGCAYDPSAGLDDPIQSFLAVGLAAGLETPVVVDSTVSGAVQCDYVVRCRWFDTADRRTHERVGPHTV